MCEIFHRKKFCSLQVIAHVWPNTVNWIISSDNKSLRLTLASLLGSHLPIDFDHITIFAVNFDVIIKLKLNN